jgi:PKD repeat protein
MKKAVLAFLPAFILMFHLHAQSWQDVGGGTNNSSHGMCLWNSLLVNGGSFGSPCGRVGAWNGTSWICFGGGVGLVARAAVEFNGDLIVCGDFWNINQPCTGCNGVARWDGTSWTPLGTGFNNDVLCLCVWNGQLVAGGDFTTADGNPSDRIAVWNGTNWYSLGGFTTTFNNDVRTIEVYNGELWAGGDFTNAGGCTACDRIVKWNGTAWVGGNSGVDIPGGLDSTVRVLYANPVDNKLYLGGHFLDVGGNTACSRVAVYDGSVWSPLGTGVDNYVRAIHYYNGNIIVGGDFANASGTPASKIAKWNPNTNTWSAMGTGMNDYVKSMEVWNGTLFAGGAFTTADGQPRAYIASWYETPAIPPVAAFTASANAICLGQCISLTDNSSNNPTSWNWTFPGGNPSSSTLQNPLSVCYNTSGTYTISLQACNVNGCSTTTQNISVSVNPQPTVTVSAGSTTICNGTSTTLTAGGATTYQWAPAAGLSATTGAGVTASPTVTTTYTVTGNSLGCTNTAAVTITVNPAPVVTVSPVSVSICPSSSASLQASGAVSYVWAPASGLSATTGPAVTASPSVSTTYTVTGTGSNGCTWSATCTVNIGNGTPLPLAEGFQSLPFVPAGWSLFDAAGDGNVWQLNTSVGGFSSTGNCAWYDNNTVNAPNTRDELQTFAMNFASLNTAQMTFDVAYCRKSNASFSDTCVVYVSTDCGMSWAQVYSKGGSTLATAPNQNGAFTPSASQWRTETVNLSAYVGFQNVTVKFQNRNHNGNNLYIDNINITGTTANPPSPSFTMSANSICPGSCVDFTDNTTGLPTSWSWTFTGGSPSSSTVQNPSTVCWNAPGTYAVTLQACNANGCSSTSQTLTVNVPVVSAGPDDTICSGGNVVLNAGGGVSYSWNPSGSLSCGTCQNPVAFPGSTTTYTVWVTDASGCTNTDTVTLTVLICTGMPLSTGEALFSLFPNPSAGSFTVSSPMPVSLIEVYNVMGQLVYRHGAGQPVMQVELGGMPQGVYLVRVLTGDRFYTRKLVIEQ